MKSETQSVKYPESYVGVMDVSSRVGEGQHGPEAAQGGGALHAKAHPKHACIAWILLEVGALTLGKVDLAQGPHRVASAAPSEWPMQRTSSTSAGAMPESASHVAKMFWLGVLVLVIVWKAARKPSCTYTQQCITLKLVLRQTNHNNVNTILSLDQEYRIGRASLTCWGNAKRICSIEQHRASIDSIKIPTHATNNANNLTL